MSSDPVGGGPAAVPPRPGPPRPGPLSGLRCVELVGIGPAPFAAMVLADLGMDVVRVGPVRPQRGANPVLDRGRRSIAVNLKDPRGLEIVRRLVDSSDAVIEGFRPGVLERLGLDPDDLIVANPALVVGRMTGYGQDGPLACAAGHDINYIATSGVLASIGRAGAPPTPPINLVGDFGGGGMLLVVGVLAALLHAQRTGRGQVVDAAMVDGSSLLAAMIHGFRAAGMWDEEHGTNLLDTGAPFYDVYACADGRYVAVGALEPQFYTELLRVLGLADRLSVGTQRDRATWGQIRELFTAAFATRTRDEWVAAFEGVDACVAPVLAMSEAPQHPHNVARAAFPRDAAGVVHPVPAPRFAGTPLGAVSVPVEPGSDTDAVLQGLGIDDAEIRRLRAAGVIGPRND